ncbi:MAG: M23 family metallopeptidase [Anaerolineaceae bacterium]|nr:M23 family metallopeptidase [Anaerolineaceae bacterium]
MTRIIFVLFLYLLTACNASVQSAVTSIKPTETLLPMITKTMTPVFTRGVTPTEYIRETLETTETVENPFIPMISSPIEGKTISDLVDMISNPFLPPGEGSDDPHQGVDFSDVDNLTKIALTGKGVQVMIGGQVIAVMSNRFPYGNAILIVSTDDNLPEYWINKIFSSTKPFPWDINTALTCPEGWNLPPEKQDKLGLYTLYAHMLNAPIYEIGDLVKPGENIGAIGMSGNALAPHLHVETRYGYIPDLIGSMAHYDVSASLEEMSNYCRWRVSGWFRLIDPMEILSTN